MQICKFNISYSPICIITEKACDPNKPFYIGCYVDDVNRDLKDAKNTGFGYIDACNEACKEYNYFALQNNGECRCGNDYGTAVQYVQKFDEECGGAEGLGRLWRNSIFKTCYKGLNLLYILITQ